MIDDTKIEMALDFYRDNANLVGQLRGQKAYLEHRLKVVRSQKFLMASGTVAERESIALASPEYVEVVEELRDCVTDLDTVWTHLKAAELKIEVWRTQAANQRRGHV